MIAIRPEDSNELILERLHKAGLDIPPERCADCAERFWTDVAKYTGDWSK